MIYPVGLKQFLRKMKHAPPRELKSFGKQSSIVRPYKIYGASHIEIGEHTTILTNAVLNAITGYENEVFAPSIRIGNSIYIGHYVCIAGVGEITIGHGCVLSDHVYITDVAHGIDPEAGLILKQKLICKGTVSIGENSFIGYRACILPGVTLGKHCVVGANSVVTHSFSEYTMVAGAPAVIIKTYSHEKHAWIPTKPE